MIYENHPPNAVDDAVYTAPNTPVLIHVLANDTDAEGDALRVSAVTQGSHGTVTIVDATAGEVRYTPDADWWGEDSFTYTVSDEHDATATASVTVTTLNRSPVAVADTAFTNDDGPVEIAVLDNDSDPDGHALTVVLVTTPEHGTAGITGAGTTVTYTPAAGFAGTDTFEYTVDDGHGGQDMASVTINVVDLVGDYLVIDLSDGASASSYPVTSLVSLPDPISDLYKTTSLVLRRIPAGTYTMGSPTNELGRWDGHEQQHEVTLTKDFYIGVFEVTQKQWERVMGNWPSYFHNTSVRNARPVEQVSYDDIRGSSAGSGWPTDNNVDASSFFGRLRSKTGLPLDLPTEAQWEYACRAGTTTALNSGKDLTSTTNDPNMVEVGRYWHNGGAGYSSGCGLANGTAAVGSYQPNAWGLYDMHGNVWEWCLDWWVDNHSSTAVTDPVGAGSGSYRMSRGAGWYSEANRCRSARRDRYPLDLRYYTIGFRACSAVSVQ